MASNTAAVTPAVDSGATSLQSLFDACKSNRLGTWFTRTKAFRRLTSWTFQVCDSNNTGNINQAELYAGVLLVHVTMAKYAGSAACYPPQREKVEELFVLADQDKSGGIDMNEFDFIMVILFNQIAGRIVMYYAFLIVIVPYLGQGVLQFFMFLRVDDGILAFDKAFDSIAPQWMLWIVDRVPDSVWNKAPQQIISMLVFFLIIPTALNKIDQFSFHAAKRAGVDHRESGEKTTKQE